MANGKPHHGVSRRTFLAGAGAAGIAGLAGCSANDNGDNENNSPNNGNNENNSPNNNGDNGTNAGKQQGGEAIDQFLTVPTSSVPGTTQWNRYNPKNLPGDPMNYVEGKLAVAASPPDKETKYFKFLLEDYEVTEEKVTLKFREGIKWNNGDELTAEDYYTQLGLDKYVGSAVWDQFIKDTKVTDKFTLEITLKQPFSKPILRTELVAREIFVNRSKYGPFLERLEEASNDEERNQVLTELQQMTMEKPITIGPFDFKDASSKTLTLERREGYTNEYLDGPITKSINFGIEATTVGTQTNMASALMEGKIDAGFMLPTEQLHKQFPDHVMVNKTLWGAGPGFIFNHKDLFGDRDLRKAFAWLAPRKLLESKTSASYLTEPQKYVTGLGRASDNEEWVGNLTDKLTKYAYKKPNEEKAAEHLRKAGYEKKNGKWQKDGEVLSFTITSRAAQTSWVSHANIMSSRLSEFGMQVDMAAQEDTTYWGSTLANSDFVIAQNYVGGPLFESHPYYAYRAARLGQASSTDKQAIKNSEQNLRPVIEVPWPPGNPDGDMKEININDKVAQLAQPLSSKERNSIVKELAWTYNQACLQYPISQHLSAAFFTSDDWTYTKQNDPHVRAVVPQRTYPRLGVMQGKTK